jgi:hypothetical protein
MLESHPDRLLVEQEGSQSATTGTYIERSEGSPRPRGQEEGRGWAGAEEGRTRPSKEPTSPLTLVRTV